MPKQLNIRSAKPVLQWEGHEAYYSEALERIRGAKVSGVYAILDTATRDILYIGESHTGRLYDTITRHFRKWKRYQDSYGRRKGGTTYDRDSCSIAICVCADHLAQDHQFDEIQRLEPRDNITTGERSTPAPF